METIEHFTAKQAKVYVARMAQRLKTGCVFTGTSAFPPTRADANALAAQNRNHPHIFTEGEFLELLRQHFSRAVVIGGWMFAAIR
jgi:cyclopropane fatty-acyl-phospholipid synthase-like methyltransferase